MVNVIDTVYVNTYEKIVRHLAQQGITRLRPWVMERGEQSEEHNWERLGSQEATVKDSGAASPGFDPTFYGNSGASTRNLATPINDSPWSRRSNQVLTMHIGDLVEQEDPVQMIVDPNSNIARHQGMAMRRAHDDAIIEAAVGDSRDGAGAPVGFPGGQFVNNTGSPISLDAVTEVTETFLENDIDPDEEKVFVIGPAQARKLLQITEATSADFNGLRPLQSAGIVTNWMGYTWIVSTRLQSPDSGTNRDCFAMTKRAIGMNINRDITARIAEDPSVSFGWRVYCYSTFGAIRVEDEHIVKLRVTDAL